jgi:hypothetical protein
MLMAELISRLRDNLRGRIRNGELTERGLARMTGLSQSHMHNVLKGARIMTPDVADLILRTLKMSLLDLLPHDAANPPRRGPARESSPPDADSGRRDTGS